MKQRVAEMEREANKLRELQAAAEQEHSAEDNGGSMETDDDKANTDGRSIYVGNVGHVHVLARLVVDARYVTGGLRGYSRRNSRPLSSLRHD